MRKTLSKEQTPTPFLYYKLNLKLMFNCRLCGVCWQRIKATNDLPKFYFVAHPNKK